MKLFDLIQEYAEHEGFGIDKKSLDGYHKDRLYLCMVLGNPEIEKVKPQAILRYMRTLAQWGWKQNSVQHKAIAFRNLWQYAKRKRLKVFDYELIPIPKREYNIPRVATYWQYKAFLDSTPTITNEPRHQRNRVIAMMLYDTGARCGELMLLNLKDLDFSDPRQGRAVIKTEKSRGTRPIREILWTQETTRELKKWLRIREEMKERHVFPDPEAVFVGTRSRQIGMRLRVSGVDMAFRLHCRKVGIVPTLHPHDLRHLKGRDMSAQGANNSQISGILGHASLASSFIYTQMSSPELRKAAQKFNQNRPKTRG